MGAFSLELVRPWNVHWTTGRVSDLVLRNPNYRAAVPHLVDELRNGRDDQWVIIAGPRQIGKTTSLGHVAQRLIGGGAPPGSVAVIPLDQPRIQEALNDDIDALISSLSTLHTATRNAPLYLLLDEVQELAGWGGRLKAAWDRHHQTVRVLATGSSAMRLIRPADADFPGRVDTRTMHPLKFREVARNHPEARDHADAGHWMEIGKLANRVRAAVTSDHEEWSAEVQALHAYVSDATPTLSDFLRRVFAEYAVWGGYPQACPGTRRGPAERRQVFEQAWNAVLARDIPAAGVKKVREFEQLFHRIASNPGGKFVPHNLGKDLGVVAETVSNWKRILEDAMLVQQLPPLKPNLQPANGKDKAYLLDPGWYAFVCGVVDVSSVVNDAQMGLLVETVLADHARRLQFNISGTTSLPVGYVRSPEVDIAVNVGGFWVLIEAKYRVNPRGSVNEIAGEMPHARAIVATRDHFEAPAKAEPTFIPAHEWALIC